MRADCYYYPETNRRPWAEQVAAGALCVSVEVADGAPLVDILAAARHWHRHTALRLLRGSTRRW